MLSIEDIKELVIEKIEYEMGVIKSCKYESEMNSTPDRRKRNLFRDIKRSESKIIAFKEILGVLLGEYDVDIYVESKLARTVV